MKLQECPISRSTNGLTFLHLGDVPLVNNLCATQAESLNCPKFPLAVQFFPDSCLTSLTETVDKDSMFLNYLYASGVNKPYLMHCEKMYADLRRLIELQPGDLVVDIGGNDGSLLNEFRKENSSLRYINVDCSRSFIETNREKKIEYINEYFGNGIRFETKAKLIISTNVFQHTLNIRDFVKDVRANLCNEGAWCLEFPYILTTLANDNYDQIYHEHIYYYCLKNIVDLLKQEDMRVIDVSYHAMHAGTLRVISVKKDSYKYSNGTCSSFLNLEHSLTWDYCLEWGHRTHEKIATFKAFMDNLRKEKKKIIGFGAAAKGCVFLNTVGITHETMPYIIDDTPFKQGKFIPGTGIEVTNRSILKYNKIDYILILAHNFKDYIMFSLRDEYKGKFIIMFPNIKVI